MENYNQDKMIAAFKDQRQKHDLHIADLTSKWPDRLIFNISTGTD